MVLHLLKVGQLHRNGGLRSALLAALARQHQQAGGRCVAGRRRLQAENVAVAQRALVLRRVDHIQRRIHHEDVRLALGRVVQNAIDAARSGIDILLVRDHLRLLVFQRQLISDLVGDHLLHVGGKRRRLARLVGGHAIRLAALHMGRIRRLQIL
jgi:ABC-type enterochelin transport system ATPase subunit